MHINAYYNGLFTSREKIRIPLTDRAVFFGDGIYDAAIGRGGKIFMLDEHIERFYSNARALDIPIKTTPQELKSILINLASSSPHECYFVYLQLTRFSPERTHSYPDTELSNLLITVTEQEMPSLGKKLKLAVEKDIRHEMCNVKALNLLPSVLASRKAALLGCDEAVLHRNGVVTEGARSNVHIITNGAVITHPLDNRILPGISRKHMLGVCQSLGIPVIERPFSLYELFKADEVLVTSSSKLALPVKQVDKIEFYLSENGLGNKICRKMLSDFINFTKKDTTNC